MITVICVREENVYQTKHFRESICLLNLSHTNSQPMITVQIIALLVTQILGMHLEEERLQAKSGRQLINLSQKPLIASIEYVFLIHMSC